MSERLQISKDMLRDIIKQTLLDADYDIFKEWDPRYDGREEDSPSWDDLTDTWWTHLGDSQYYEHVDG